MIKNLFLIYVAQFISFFAISQGKESGDVSGLTPNILPPSPNAAALAKYAETPVSLYTGLPSINIPVYSVHTGDLELPISFDYHSGGIKVDEIATNIGLGWILNCGGAITRSVRGIPDETINTGYLNNGIDLDVVMSADASTKKQYFDNVNKNLTDLQPDLYYFNFFGKSGSFILDRITKAGYLVDNNQKLTISWIAAGLWQVTDASGFNYYFGNYGGESAMENNIITQNGRATPYTVHYPSSWYLVKAVDTKGNEINFHYTSYSTTYCQATSETRYWLYSESGYNPNSCKGISNEKFWDETEISGYKISVITWESGHINFNYSTISRSDINTTDNFLDNITVFNNQSPNPIFKFNLSHSYFALVGGAIQSVCGSDLNGRLKLDKIQQVGINGEMMAPYQLIYDGGLPSKNSYSQDHWGYYNGAVNTTLIPKMYYQNTCPPITLDGADRRPNVNYAKKGSLIKIIYPTAGSIVFNFEQNDSYMSDLVYEQTDLQGIGYANVSKTKMNGAPFEYETFTVQGNIPCISSGQMGDFVTIITNVNGTCDPSQRPGCGGDLYITPISGTAGSNWSFGQIGNVTNTKVEEVFLLNGTYRLALEVTNNFNELNIVSCTVSGPDHSSVAVDGKYNKPIGGLRLSSQEVYDAFGNKEVISYKYHSDTDVLKSSGVLVNQPKYDYYYNKIQQTQVAGFIYHTTCNYLVRTSQSKVILGQTQGNPVGYGYVEVIKGDDQTSPQIKSSYKYTTAQDYPDNISYLFPFPPATSRDMERGLLLETKEYKFENGLFTEIRKTTNTYKIPDSRYSKTISAIAVGCNSANPDGSCAEAVFSKYAQECYWVWKDQEIINQKSSNNVANIVSTSKYYYDNLVHLQSTRIELTNSKNEKLITLNKYAGDFADADADQVTKDMKGVKHMHNSVVQTIQIRDDGSMENVIGSKIIKYNYANGFIAPVQKIFFKNRLPVDYNNVTVFPIYKPISGYDINAYERRLLMGYDRYGNVVFYQKSDNIYSSYLWDYNNDLVIAEVISASNTDIAYTSFESDGTGNWTINSTTRYPNDGVTGNQYYQLLNGAITKTGLTSGNKYTVSYWTKSGSSLTINGTTGTKGRFVSGWTYYEHLITLSGTTITVPQVSGAIDELRLYPAGAEMITYTYEPLVGMSTSCDAANRIIYYEYDGFQRLKLIRNQDQNIIKQFDYQYQQP